MELQLLRTRHPPEVFLQQLAQILISEGFDIDVDQLHQRIEALPEEDRLILAVQGEALYGYAHLQVVHELIDCETALVASIIVAPDHRRKGIGSLLLAAAETWSRQSGRPRLILRTDAERQGSQIFFTTQGYKVSTSNHEFFDKVGD